MSEDGAQGVQGIQGERGAQGQQGVQGLQGREPGKATLLAILNEVRASRADVKAAVADHEARIRVLERKNMKVSAVVSGVVSIIVALAALFGTGCAAPRVNAGTLSREATTQVRAVGLTPYGVRGWSGTGWYIASEGDRSVIATAGHVCASEMLTLYEVSDGTLALPIYDHDEDANDVCLLEVMTKSRPLKLGSVPDIGDAVTYTGYPDGVLGTYHGEVSGIDPEDGLVLVSIPAYFGASGSAVLDDKTGRVVGMLVMGDPNFPGHAWLVGVDRLKEARDFANDYLETL